MLCYRTAGRSGDQYCNIKLHLLRTRNATCHGTSCKIQGSRKWKFIIIVVRHYRSQMQKILSHLLASRVFSRQLVLPCRCIPDHTATVTITITQCLAPTCFHCIGEANTAVTSGSSTNVSQSSGIDGQRKGPTCDEMHETFERNEKRKQWGNVRLSCIE